MPLTDRTIFGRNSSATLAIYRWHPSEGFMHVMPNSSNIPMLRSGTTADLRSEPPRNMPSAPAHAGQWRYDSHGWTRDLRIDFLRGCVFILLFTGHFSFFSWFSLVAWERLGVRCCSCMHGENAIPLPVGSALM